MLDVRLLAQLCVMGGTVLFLYSGSDLSLLFCLSTLTPSRSVCWRGMSGLLVRRLC